MKKKILIILAIIMVIVLITYGIIYLKNKDKVAVLCYHNIATAEEKAKFPEESEFIIDVNNFEEQLKFLKINNYKTLTMDEFYEWKQGKLKIPVNSVLITFDDGFLSNYQYAFPLLKKYNMNATVFVVGQFSDEATEDEWTGNVKTYMTDNVITKAKEEYPNIQFCSHSYYLHYEKAIDEIKRDDISFDAGLFQIGFFESKYYAYPFGLYNYEYIEGLKDAKYNLAFMFGPNKNDFRKASIKDDNYKIPRLNVSSGMPIWKFALRLWIVN